ncbi:unnamed protein product [Rotaria sp. Silwood2]|nr:unnamed protein product [Rotaria sp. Silwood2]CAF2980182.1 unnamed protein product [Rotaria sp. Silwood2]CAF3187486.1 unnamed protein product [Rotaria sp. Silwood2]CAF3322509.1 unnamed protein product [Rotaria sp. Silwood2]CAF4078944.1 unnamed protein product [Rotaria sp. Silwood2]
MASCGKTTEEISLSLEKATNWARSNCEWEKVYQYIFLNPTDFFVISPERRYSIAHQMVHHGNVDLFKRFMTIFSDQHIDIHIKTRDNKTFLDIAKEQKNNHPAMYTYIEHLFLQDKLMEQAKQSNWREVIEILEQDNKLVNEKPPYSPRFLIHYAVEYGDTHTLQVLLDNYNCLINVLNSDDETPLALAKRLNKHDMCSILEARSVKQKNNTSPKPPLSASIQNLERLDDRSSYDSTKDNVGGSLSSTKSLPSSSTIGMPNSMPSPIGFSTIVNDILRNNNFQFEQLNINNTNHSQSTCPYQEQLSISSQIKHVEVNRSIISEYPLTDIDPILSTTSNEYSAKNKNSSLSNSSSTVSMTSTSSNNDSTKDVKSPTTNSNPASSDEASSLTEQFMRALKCPITHKFFVDPVIASDGETYERSAIVDWIKTYHSSPKTGKPMDATVRDHVECKRILQKLLSQS